MTYRAPPMEGGQALTVPFAWDRPALVDRDNGLAVDDDYPRGFLLR
ncbi:MAG: hypothetical protein H6875_00675 [Hyphomicrobiaceae bacterium]|nr:hypothetical protein [Hyphomicrobiaceae bacterium]